MEMKIVVVDWVESLEQYYSYGEGLMVVADLHRLHRTFQIIDA